MDQPLISVIVPVYGIDRYIGVCIESILNQTYRNLDIILVDDGSRDRSPEIVDLYSRKDSRIRVIHKPNGGLVSARKAGLRQSYGSYIVNVDGDDWIGPGFIEGLYTAARTSGADMVCAGYTKDLFSKTAHFYNALPSGVYEGETLTELQKRMISCGEFYRPGVFTYVWNKLFRRELLLVPQSTVDNRISLGEDGAVTYPALLNCKRVAVTDNVAYHYRQREDSMLKSSACYADEAQRLKVLYEYLMRWAQRADPALQLESQVVDYVLSIAIIRSGGRLPQDDYSTFDKAYFGKRAVIVSAGTFGQQLINRFRETRHCEVTAWLDDDYWEYRRCGLDVDPVERITALEYDYVLIAAVDTAYGATMKKRLLDLGVGSERVLTVTPPEDRKRLLSRFLDVDAIRAEETKRKREVLSHA